jgi:hypothetical protein
LSSPCTCESRQSATRTAPPSFRYCFLHLTPAGIELPCPHSVGIATMDAPDGTRLRHHEDVWGIFWSHTLSPDESEYIYTYTYTYTYTYGPLGPNPITYNSYTAQQI